MNISKIFNLMTTRGLYFTQGGFWFRYNLYFNKGIKRWVGIKYTIGFVLQFAIDGFCITHDPKEIKKTLFKIGGNLGSFGITHDSKEAK